MKKIKFSLLLSLAILLGLTSCGEKKVSSKVVLNEVLIENENNFQDDYGIRSAWIEVFNRSYTSADIAGYLLKVSKQTGDTVSYFIPKGDVLTLIKPRQHALFWADAQPNRGTFHTNFTLDANADNWVGLYNSGHQLIDQIVIPANTLGKDQSYARVTDASKNWEVKGNSDTKYVTPSTNNQTLNSNEKRDKFALHDSTGIGMAVTAMSVVFCGLLILFISFNIVGKVSINMGKMRLEKLKNKRQDILKDAEHEIPGEVIAAISMALHEKQNDIHDIEDTVLTISRVKRSYSPWSSKIYTLRETPHRK